MRFDGLHFALLIAFLATTYWGTMNHRLNKRLEQHLWVLRDTINMLQREREQHELNANDARDPYDHERQGL